jgi:hypothetical protein
VGARRPDADLEHVEDTDGRCAQGSLSLDGKPVNIKRTACMAVLRADTLIDVSGQFRNFVSEGLANENYSHMMPLRRPIECRSSVISLVVIAVVIHV